MGLLNYGKYARCARLLREDICTSNLKLRVLNGAFWVFVGTALAKAIVLIAGICCAQILNKEQYGELGMVRSTINMFVAFGVAGLGLTATKYISEYRASQKERIGSIYILTNGFAYITGALITIVVLLLSPNIASQSLQAPYLVNEIRLGGLLLFVTVINGAQNGTLVGFEKFRSIACNTFIGSLAESIGIILGSYYYGVSGAILGYGTGFLVLYIANYVSIRNVLENEGVEVHLSMFRLEDLNLLYRFSLPAMLSSIMVVPAFWLVRSMLVRSNGFDELAIYEAADQWKVVMLFIPTAISQIVLPILSSIVVGGNKGEYWRILKMNIKINATVSLIMALLICAFSSTIMGAYGKGYSDDIWPLIFLAISTVFTSISNVVGLAIASRSKMWVGFTFNLIWAVLLVVFTFLFLDLMMGAIGVALAILCSYVLHTLFQLIYLRALRRV